MFMIAEKPVIVRKCKEIGKHSHGSQGIASDYREKLKTLHLIPNIFMIETQCLNWSGTCLFQIMEKNGHAVPGLWSHLACRSKQVLNLLYF